MWPHFQLGLLTAWKMGSAGSRSSRKRGHKLPALLKARPWADTVSFGHIVLAEQTWRYHSCKGNWNKLSLKGVIEIGHLSAYIVSSTLRHLLTVFLLSLFVMRNQTSRSSLFLCMFFFFLPPSQVPFKTLSFFFSSLTMMCLDVIFFIFTLLGFHWASLIVGSCVSPIWKIISAIFSNFFSFVSSVFMCYLICWRRENLRPCSWIWKHGSWWVENGLPLHCRLIEVVLKGDIERASRNRLWHRLN